MEAMIRRSLCLIIAYVLASWIPALAQAQLKPNIVSPSNGIQTNVPDLLRTKEYAKVLDNLHMTKKGVWTDRGSGWAPQRAGTFNGGTAFLEMADHSNSTGVHKFVFQVAGKVYSYNIGTSTETQISTGLSTTTVPCMKSYSSTVFLWVNGQQEPLNWDGNDADAMTSPGGWPPTVGGTSYANPSLCEVFGTRAVYAGFAAQPYTVLFSQASTPNGFTVNSPQQATDAGAFTLPTVLGPIVGLRTLRLANITNDLVVIIGCSRGIAFIGGTDATNYYQREITRTYGVLSNRAWIQLQNDLYFPATDGIRNLSNLNTAATMAPDTQSFGVNDLYQRVNQSKGAMIFAVHHPAAQEVQFWCPVDSDTTCKHVFVMNYNSPRNPDGTVAPVFSTMDTVEGACGFDYENVEYIGGVGSTVGLLCQYFNGDTYNGTMIPWVFMPALIETNAQNPFQSSSSKRMLILTEGDSQAFDAQAYVIDTQQGSVSEYVKVFDQRLSAASSSINDLTTWGSGTTTKYGHLIEFDPPGNARYWGIRLFAQNSGDHINVIGVAQLQLSGGSRE